VLYPVVAPALILVGTMMIGAVRHIPWDEPAEAIPAFLTMVVMPLAVSITDGIAFGFIAYAALKIAVGRSRDAHWLVYLFAVLVPGSVCVALEMKGNGLSSWFRRFKGSRFKVRKLSEGRRPDEL
jgi:xanthine/uracil/vitamin C permease (AzgA family)